MVISCFYDYIRNYTFISRVFWTTILIIVVTFRNRQVFSLLCLSNRSITDLYIPLKIFCDIHFNFQREKFLPGNVFQGQMTTNWAWLNDKLIYVDEIKTWRKFDVHLAKKDVFGRYIMNSLLGVIRKSTTGVPILREMLR